MKKAAAFSEIAKQHEALKKDINRLRATLTDRPKGESADATRAAVKKRAAQLSSRLRQHFKIEEEGGYLDAVVAAGRGLGSTVAKLQRQHVILLGDLARIEKACSGKTSLKKTTDIVVRVVELLRRHEAEECRVMQEAVIDDLGVGD